MINQGRGQETVDRKPCLACQETQGPAQNLLPTHRAKRGELLPLPLSGVQSPHLYGGLMILKPNEQEPGLKVQWED